METLELLLGIIAVILSLASLIIRFGRNNAGTQVVLTSILVITYVIQILLFGGDTLQYVGFGCWFTLLIWDTIRWLK